MQCDSIFVTQNWGYLQSQALLLCTIDYIQMCTAKTMQTMGYVQEREVRRLLYFCMCYTMQKQVVILHGRNKIARITWVFFQSIGYLLWLRILNYIIFSNYTYLAWLTWFDLKFLQWTDQFHQPPSHSSVDCQRIQCAMHPLRQSVGMTWSLLPEWPLESCW